MRLLVNFQPSLLASFYDVKRLDDTIINSVSRKSSQMTSLAQEKYFTQHYE